jgi:isocitrate lyase
MGSIRCRGSIGTTAITGYFDDVTTVIQGGKSSVTALTGSTEEEQFH